MDDFLKRDTQPEAPAAKPAHSSVSNHGGNNHKPQKKSLKFKLTVVLLAALLALTSAGLVYLFLRYQDTQKQVEKLSTVQGQQELNKTQVNELLGEMRSIIVLPKDEDPVVATITDISKLEKTDFYKDAKNDDRVVVFPKAEKAYIYRPSTKTIVNVGAFKVDDSQNTQAQPTN